MQGSVQALRESLIGAVATSMIRINVIGSRRRRHHRVRRHAGGDLQGHHHRLQRPCRRLRAPHHRVQRRRPALLLDHLRRDRPGEAGGFRPARRGDPRGDHRHRRGPRRVPQLQVRRGRRLHGHRGHGQAQQADPRAARQRRGLRRRAGIAAPLQGERRRSAQRHRVRHRREGSTTTSSRATRSSASSASKCSARCNGVRAAMAQKKSFHRTDRVSAQLRRELGTLVHAGRARARPAVGQRVRRRGHPRPGARQGVRHRADAGAVRPKR